MKKLILSFLLILPSIVSAQELPIDKGSGLISYAEVVPVEGVSQDELYSRIREYFVNTFKSADDVIQMDDKAGGKIIGKAFSDIVVYDGKVSEKRRLWYTLKVEMKDGRYRYELKDFLMQRYCLPRMPVSCEVQTKPVAAEIILSPSNKVNKKGKPSQGYASFQEELNKTAESLIASIKNTAVKSTDSEW